MTMASRLSDARMGGGLSQQDAAKRLGVKVETLRDWESGEKSPRANKLQMIAGVYDVSLIWLLEGRSDLDPLGKAPNDMEALEVRLHHITNLQNELSAAISELCLDVKTMKERNNNLDRLAEETLSHKEYRKAG